MNQIGKRLLLRLEIIEVATFSLIAVCRIFTWHTGEEVVVGSLAAALYFSWLLWEMRHVSSKDLKRATVTKKQASMELAAVAKFCLLITAFVATKNISVNLGILGLILLALGMALRIAAIYTLKDAYSHQITNQGVTINDHGVYGLIRHPAYLGTFIAHTGLVLVFFNGFSAVALLFWYVAVISRTLNEEKVMAELAAYQEYSQRVNYRLLPFIW